MKETALFNPMVCLRKFDVPLCDEGVAESTVT